MKKIYITFFVDHEIEFDESSKAFFDEDKARAYCDKLDIEYAKDMRCKVEDLHSGYDYKAIDIEG